jgi:hypothetical protein
MHDTRRVTEEQAIALLREWQEEFRLCDWNLQLAIRRKPELKRHGDIRIGEGKICAFIRLLHADDADPLEMEPLDHELTIVHEAIHVALAPFIASNEHLDVVQEQAIHRLSQAFVRMKRELRLLRAKDARRTARYAPKTKPHKENL